VALRRYASVNLDAFTEAQQRALTAGDGACALIAGPGCGKTTTLAGRITYLVSERHADPSEILALTFTTEAARRLRREVGRQLDDRAADVSILTLHALGRKVIDTWPVQLGYDERPSVIHYEEARNLMASTAVGLGWDLAAISMVELAAAVDRCRLLVDADARLADPLGPLADAYEDRLRRHGVVDFVGMLSLPLRLFEKDERALRVLQDAYRWVIADEVQDLDPSQWRLVELLAARHGNLLVAGDDLQCIYAWRGADPHALARFPVRYPTAAVVTLEKNHRSTQRLVMLGNCLSDLLGARPSLLTDNPPGPLPRLLMPEDEHAEAAFVAEQIGSLVDRGILPHPGEAAVLFRTGAQADVLAGALRAAGLPYALHGHADLFGAWAVRDLLAYLRLALNPRDRTALARIADIPPRGLRQLAATLLEEPADTAELSTRAADFGPDAAASAAALAATIYELHADASRGATLVDLLDRALDRTSLRAWLERQPDAVRRLRLVARLRALVQRTQLPPDEWLDGVALGDEVVDTDEEAARLSTVHRVKGREFRAAFLAGLEEGLMPHYRAIDHANRESDSAALEEELRVCYVALSRARERLFVSACRERWQAGHTERRQPSRWLYAFPPELLAVA
jgi:DNA helicase II / ATP-dependent DNA helicase PcrA